MESNKQRPVNLIMNPYDGVLNDINIFINNKGDYYPYEHTHSFYEFIFLANGSIINTINGEQVVLTKNTLAILKPNSIHKILLNNSSDFLLFNLEVNAQFLNNLSKNMSLDDLDSLITSPVTYLQCSNSEYFEINQLFNIAHQQPTFPLKQFYLKLLVVKFLTKLTINQYNTPYVNNEPSSEIVDLVLQELNNPDNFRLSNNKICTKLNYTQEYVIRLFKKANLDSPNKIFLKNKLNYAATLLGSSKIRIIDIAEMCGIYSISYFNKVFKNEFNKSPSQWRREHKFIRIKN